MASSRSGASGGTILASGIRTRERKERKLYSDDWALGDEEIEGHQTFDLEQKISSEKFDSCFVKDMSNTEYNLKHVQKHGFNWPLLFKDKSQLGITIPSSEFTINDVRLCVGSRRMLDVMDVNTQKNVEMTMKDWQRYFESQDKDKLLNVISLEFSHTKLEQLVQAPTVVRQIDWVERVWPRHLKEAQTEATNVLEDMMYPKVQKYCLMSVGGCYTDFHIDFGGTSVWYHILRGKKIFWLIPPTERNFQLYEQWVLSGKQSDIFFGDTVDKCARIELSAGNTFFIPTGWIHAVYTPEDSLVFGGNFLHSFGIEKQLRVAQVEDATHVPQKFRYPFFTEMLWYVLERYVHVLLDKTHLTLPPDEEEKYKKYASTKAKPNNNNQMNEVKEETPTKPDPAITSDSETKENENGEEHVHLTQYELHGLKAIVMYLHALPTSKKCVPDLITDPIALIRDVRTVVEKHRYDIPEKSLTSLPILEWWPREPTRFGWKRPLMESTPGTIRKRRRNSDENTGRVGLPPNVSKVRHRRIRCRLCEPCTRDDCRQCLNCRDMVKYGGSGTMKQSCKMKKCTQPMLPSQAACYECGLDGWNNPPMPSIQRQSSNSPNSLFECCICYKISHLSCLVSKFENVEGIVNEDLPNSWECPECVKEGYNKEYKHNRVASRASGSDTGEPRTPSILSDADDADVKVKIEPIDEGVRRTKTMDGSKSIKVEHGSIIDTAPPHMPKWEELQARVSRPLVRPMWVVRPNPPAPSEEEEEDDEDDEDSGSDSESRSAAREPIPPPMNRSAMFPVFRYLSVKDLTVAMRVCRSWASWAIHPSLWKVIKLTHKKINKYNLTGIVRRQPDVLDLSWTRITKEQLSWLLARLPQLHELHLEGQSWQTISCLTSPYCPPLSVLNVSYCEGLADVTLNAILSPPRTHRPGHRDTTTRLKQLTELRLAGTHVGDEGVRSIVRSLPFLTSLNLSSCLHITEMAVDLLAHPSSVVSHSLSSLDLRGCHQLAPTCLPSLKCLPLLANLALHPCSRIPLKAIQVWGKHHNYTFGKDKIMTRDPPTPPDPTDEPMSDSEISSLSRSSTPGCPEAKFSCKMSTKSSNIKFEEGNDQITIPKDHKEAIILQNSHLESGMLIMKEKDEDFKTAEDVSAKKAENISKDFKKENYVNASLGESSKVSDSGSSSFQKNLKLISSDPNHQKPGISKIAKETNPVLQEEEKNLSSSNYSDGSSQISQKVESYSIVGGSGVRVSTRRQSRLQESDVETNSTMHNLNKTPSEQIKISPEDKVEKKELSSKKNKNSIDTASSAKRNLLEENSEEKASTSSWWDKKTILDESNKKETTNTKPCTEKILTSKSLLIKSEKIDKELTEKPSVLHVKKMKITLKPLKVDEVSEHVLKTEQNQKENQEAKKIADTNERPVHKRSNTSERVGKRGLPDDEIDKSDLMASSSSKDAQKDDKVSSLIGKDMSEETMDKSVSSRADKRSGDGIGQQRKKMSPVNKSKNNSTKELDKKKSTDMKEQSTESIKGSECDSNQKNVIVTSAEVHHAENYKGHQDVESNQKRPERRLSVRRSKEEQDLKLEEKIEKGTTDAVKDKRRDSKTREDEMNKITVENSSNKDSKHNKKRVEDKDKKQIPSKKIFLKQNIQSPMKIKQEKDIVTRSTKRLKIEKDEKNIEQILEGSVKPTEKSAEIRKTNRKSREALDDKEERLANDDGDKKEIIKSPKPTTHRKDKEHAIGKLSLDKKEDAKSSKRNRSDTEEYMAKLRRKSQDSDGSNDALSMDLVKKDEALEEKNRSRRRLVRDEDSVKKYSLENKSKEDLLDENQAVLDVRSKSISKNSADLELLAKQTKRKTEDEESGEITSIKRAKEEKDEGTKSFKKTSEVMRDRSSSRERPERPHRSPRRLSMCQ